MRRTGHEDSDVLDHRSAGRGRARCGRLLARSRPCARIPGRGTRGVRACRRGRRAAEARRRRSGDGPQGPVLARPDGAGTALRQARQVALHGHDARARVRRRRRRRVDASRSIRACSRTSACARPKRRARASPRRSTAVGSVAFNERDQAVVQARANGFVEKLFVRAPLDPVRSGQPLLELYVPDWVAAQEEYLAVRRMKGAGMDALADAARQRMRLAGMSDEQIERVVASGTRAAAHHDRRADRRRRRPNSRVREGMTVAMGAPLFRINGLGSVWVNAEVPESRGGARARRRRRSKCARLRSPAPSSRGAVRRDAARDQPADAHDQGAHRGRQPRRAAGAGMFYASVDFAAGRRARDDRRAVRGGDRHRQARRRDRRRGRRQVPPGRRRSRHRSERHDRDPQGHRARPEGRRVGPVPHRLRSEPQGHDDAAVRARGGDACRARGGHRRAPRRRPRREDRAGRDHAVARSDPVAQVGRDDDGLRAAGRGLARVGQGRRPRRVHVPPEGRGRVRDPDGDPCRRRSGPRRTRRIRTRSRAGRRAKP